MFFLHCLTAFCEVIELTVICEKFMRDDSVKATEFLLRKVFEEYNDCFSQTGIEFHLKSLLDFPRFSKMPEFMEFGYLVGQIDASKREKSLSGYSSNLIVLYSSSDKNNTEFNRFSPCKGRYFKNIGKTSISEEIFTIILEAINEWIEGTFSVKLPDVLNENRKKVYLNLNYQIIKDLQACKKPDEMLTSVGDVLDLEEINELRGIKKPLKNSSRLKSISLSGVSEELLEEMNPDRFLRRVRPYNYVKNLKSRNVRLDRKFRLPAR